MNILPTIRIKRGAVVGNEIFAKFPDVSNYPSTFLSADEAASQTTLSVIDGTTLGGSQFALIEVPGIQEGEIIQLSSVTTTTVVVSSGTAYAHPRGTKITGIPFDRIEISTDDNLAFTSPTTLVTEAFDIEQNEHFFNHTTGAATDFYRVRFNDSVGSLFSQFSDVILATGFANNTVFMVKRRALRSVGHKIGDFAWLTASWMNEVIEEGRRDLEANFDHWSFRKRFNSDIGNVVAGQFILTVPTDLREPTTRKNLLALYIGNDRTRLEQVDQKTIDDWYEGTAFTTLSSTLSASAISMSLTDGRDFTLSGSVIVVGTPPQTQLTGTIDPAASTTVTGVNTNFDGEVEAGDVIIVSSETRTVASVESDTSLTIRAAFSDNANDTTPDVIKYRFDTVDYTDNDLTTNTLFGVSNVQFGGWASGTNVWQGVSLGLPRFYTVNEDGIVVNVPFSFDYHNQNIRADYWGTFTSIDSDADTFDEPDYDQFVNYLAYRIKKRKAKGVLKMEDDDDGRQFLRRSAKLIARERHEQGVSRVPEIRHLIGEE